MTDNKWKKFEDLAAHIQRRLSPEAVVRQNEYILGKRSKRKRQIDITVRKEVRPYELLIVIDCKDYKRPVDVKDVESFIGLTKDVGAN
ncbi:MAG TPA: restriction endonuclease, partial [Pyrinomonadaceae bacterium]